MILDFWATWCPPCREEIPNFIDLQKQYGDQGLQVIGISLDQVKPPEVASFVKAQGINYPIVMGSEAVASQYGDIQAIPTTFVIDQKGNHCRPARRLHRQGRFRKRDQEPAPRTCGQIISGISAPSAAATFRPCSPG